MNMNMNMNKTSLGLGVNTGCNSCPFATNKTSNVTNNVNQQVNVNNYLNKKDKITIIPSLPPR